MKWYTFEFQIVPDLLLKLTILGGPYNNYYTPKRLFNSAFQRGFQQDGKKTTKFDRFGCKIIKGNRDKTQMGTIYLEEIIIINLLLLVGTYSRCSRVREIFLEKLNKCLSTSSLGCKYMDKGDPRKPRTLMPQEQ